MLKNFFIVLLIGTLPVLAEPQFTSMEITVMYLIVLIIKAIILLPIIIMVLAILFILRKAVKSKKNRIE